MADLRRAEKIALAKKRLQQFQQKNRDSQSESGRSTPSKKRTDEEFYGLGQSTHSLQSENGGSTHSLSQGENLSSNISRTESPIVTDLRMDNLCQIFNGTNHSQPDILGTTNTHSALPNVSETVFQIPSPQSFFSHSPPPVGQPGSDFFDNLSSGNDPPDRSSQVIDSALGISRVPESLLNLTVEGWPHVNASTPDGPLCQDTPEYSFPEVSISPIVNNVSRRTHEESAVNQDHEQLKMSVSKNEQLEQELAQQKSQILQLQSHLEDMKKKADEGASTLKHHVHAIEILVSEKTELQNYLEKRQEEIQTKTGEVEELQGRLRASRHRVSDLEKELNSTRSRLQALETSTREETGRHAHLLEINDNLGKRVGDLELEVSDLQSKLDNNNLSLSSLQDELKEKTSQLCLAEVRIQQLSGGPDIDGKVEAELRNKNEELLATVTSLESRLGAETRAKDESMKEYQQYVNRLHAELQELTATQEAGLEQFVQLSAREQQLVQQVSELERQLNKAPQPREDPALQTLQEQLRTMEERSQALQSQLENKSVEVEALQMGLHERALRIQELEVTVDRLETERPNTANLQAAIESDKVAASRAVAQNNALKKQLEELQEALVKLSNNNLELTSQLQHEQHHSRDLTEKLDRIQGTKGLEQDKGLQTESPTLQESECQTTLEHPHVSCEAMGKLEEKFRKKMSELADMSDDKQRLEHLVMQLQSETETIGEYITIYQIQRSMLRQRAQEKDEQVARLAEDKEALRNKLAQLNCLVQRLVGNNSSNSPLLNGLESEMVAEQKDVSELTVVPTHHVTATTTTPTPPTTPHHIETAQQIQSLLTEIGTSSLVTPSGENTNINFHPCPWCSGRLITV